MKKKPLILVIEDDPAFNKMLSSYLESKKAGHIRSFLSGNQCISELKEKPNVVLVDYDMPGINGIETMRKIKLKYPETIFIFLSGQTKMSVAIDALQSGAYDYVIKDEFAKENAHFKVINALCFEKARKQNKFYKYGFFITLMFFIFSVSYILFKNLH